MSSAPAAPLKRSQDILIGAMAPLSTPGWVEAGHSLIAGVEIAIADINRKGGVSGRPLRLAVEDTAADPGKAVAFACAMASQGAAGLVGEFHSVVARAVAAQADRLGLPFVCSSAVIDPLIDHASQWVARLAPRQSAGWRIFGEHLLSVGHRRIAIVAETSVYWASGILVLRRVVESSGGEVIEVDGVHGPLCEDLLNSGATGVLVLAGHPEPAISVVETLRSDHRLDDVLIGAPAGQPEFEEWPDRLGRACASIPFLRYRHSQLTSTGERVASMLRERPRSVRSFIGFEGYDAVMVLADLLRRGGIDQSRAPSLWPRVSVDGTRGRISLSRAVHDDVWHWAEAPVQIVERDPETLAIRVVSPTGSSLP